MTFCSEKLLQSNLIRLVDNFKMSALKKKGKGLFTKTPQEKTAIQKWRSEKKHRKMTTKIEADKKKIELLKEKVDLMEAEVQKKKDNDNSEEPN